VPAQRDPERNGVPRPVRDYDGFGAIAATRLAKHFTLVVLPPSKRTPRLDWARLNSRGERIWSPE
jgi:hypothetical protein